MSGKHSSLPFKIVNLAIKVLKLRPLTKKESILKFYSKMFAFTKANAIKTSTLVIVVVRNKTQLPMPTVHRTGESVKESALLDYDCSLRA